MADGTRVCGASAIAHLQSCGLHDNERMKMCSGTLKRGGNCANKATGPPIPGMMQTCKTHRDQLKISGWCQAPLSCGFECGQLFQWKAHGFNFCPNHRDNSTTCYFFKIPTEMRLRIYGYLLPDRHIPARFGSYIKHLRSDGERVHTSILRVNRQIHDEATGLLYGGGVFAIELFGRGMIMCNLGNSFTQFMTPAAPVSGNHALQDYQMQLMLLEQQNKKRLLMARQEQDGTNGESSTVRRPPPCLQQHKNSSSPFAYGRTEPVWSPPINERYFNMIGSFLIEVVFPSRGPNSARQRAAGTPDAETASDKDLESRLYDYSDDLHKLIGRLQLVQRPIARIEIVFKFYNTYIDTDEALSAVQLLLQPFRRLGNVTKPKVISATMNDNQGRETELLVPDLACSSSSEASHVLADYLKNWSRDLSSSEPSIERPKVFEAYWQLDKLLDGIKEYSHHIGPKFYQLADLRHAARIAREAGDLAYFRGIWNQVVNIWFDYLNSQREFQTNMARSIDDIYDIVGKDSEMNSPRSA